MKKLGLLSFLVFGLASIFATCVFVLEGCSSSPGCFIQEQATNIASATVAKELVCANTEAVKADIGAMIAKAGLCKDEPKKTGAIADAFCPYLTAKVVEYIASQAIPPAWACNPVDATSKLAAKLLEACQKIPVVGPPN